MKRLSWIFLVLVITGRAESQVRLPVYPDSLFSTYYHQRVSHFETLPKTQGDIIFLGNSITDGGEWATSFHDLKIRNYGISGDVTAGVISRLNDIAGRKPAKVFLLIGTNDLARNISPDSVFHNIQLIAAYLKQQTPATQLFVQSILPVNDDFGKFGGHMRRAAEIVSLNARLKEEAAAKGYSYLDIHTEFADEHAKLKPDLTNDGLHLTGKGYLFWKHLLFPHVYGLQKEVSLLPKPQQVRWQKGHFPLTECGSISFRHPSLRQEALHLQKELRSRGLDISVNDKNAIDKAIVLNLGDVDAPVSGDEAYQLRVTEDNVILTANTSEGVFRGIQTLLQLARDGVLLDACTITDWPAFSWRGYMIDVGRNFMSMALLKQQIDMMSKYKLNVFHFHATEDIAWRIAIKQYPQLTSPGTMLRNKGQYYSEEEIRELIAFCKERYITFVPEIDMPGHSAAFRRAMGTDMQTDTGMQFVKNILTEFCNSYDVPYIHIGADEVKITNMNFIPEVTAHIERLGKTVIGWQPGGNFTSGTIRQLWMDDNGKIARDNAIRYIDSRHLYLNHMDPLEAVVTLYNRQIGNHDAGDSRALGGTLCTWHDRSVGKEDDILGMNPVYPGMLAFAERVWQGGGVPGWVANISEGDVSGFANFERRLLDQKILTFRNMPFPYVEQAGIDWNLYGPYPNRGELNEKFAPETNLPGKLQAAAKATGGTVVLRHWWAPLVRGAIVNPKDSTTWYAYTKMWSDETREKDFWIGFNNLSRSPATDSPPLGAWDNKGSAVWVNGKLIPPPRWKRGGQPGHSEIPLTDEGYEYREPTRIMLQKGWNEVLIKAPVGSFKGKDWQNPVKWQFTFVAAGK